LSDLAGDTFSDCWTVDLGRHVPPCAIGSEHARPNASFRTLSVEGRVPQHGGDRMGNTFSPHGLSAVCRSKEQPYRSEELDDLSHTMDIGLAWKSTARLSPAARAFC